MQNDEMKRVQQYLRNMLKTENLTLSRSVRDDMVEVLLDGEFIATLTRDDEDGEVSYNLSMAILGFDLDEVDG